MCHEVTLAVMSGVVCHCVSGVMMTVYYLISEESSMSVSGVWCDTVFLIIITDVRLATH